MAEHEVAELKDILYNQYVINGKLLMELEDEREASATAASEVLSMVLRLEREKALEMMESCQYRRMSEVKMRHMEECTLALEKLVRQKDREISVLKGQLHAYNLKLSSFTINKSVDCGDIRTHNAILKKNPLPPTVRRCKSLPSLRLAMTNLETDGSSNRRSSFHSGPLVWRSTQETDVIAQVGACDSREAKGKKKCELNSGNNYYQTSEHINLWSSEEKYAACLQQSASSDNTNMRNSNIKVLSGACLISETRVNEVKPDEFITFHNDMESDWRNKLSDPEVDICCLPVPSEQYKPFVDVPVGGTNKTIGMEDTALRNLDNTSLDGAFMHRNFLSKFSTPSNGISLHHASEVSIRTKSALTHYKSVLAEFGNKDNSLSQNCTKRIQADAQYAQDELKLKLSGREDHLKPFQKLYKQLKTIMQNIICDRPRKCHLNDDPKVAFIMEAALSFSI